MTPTSSLTGIWYVDGASLVLAALTYVLIARLLIDVAFGNGGDNVVFRAVRWLTAPFVRLVGAIMPRVVPGALVTCFTIAWLLAARIVLIQVAAAMAMRRRMG